MKKFESLKLIENVNKVVQAIDIFMQKVYKDNPAMEDDYKLTWENVKKGRPDTFDLEDFLSEVGYGIKKHTTPQLVKEHAKLEKLVHTVWQKMQ